MVEKTNMDNFTHFVDNKLYLQQEGYDIPKEIDHFKKWLRRIFSLKMVWASVMGVDPGVRGGHVHRADDFALHLREEAGEEREA